MVKIATVLAIAWRLYLALRWEEFWYDEAFSSVLARLPVDRLLLATGGDVHPPLYYLLLKGWLRLMPESLTLQSSARLLSLAISLVALRLYWHVIRGLPRKQRNIAWLIVLWLPGLVYYSAEARMYALLAAYTLAAFVLMSAPVRYGVLPDLAHAFGAGICCAGMVLTHNAGVLYCCVLATAVLNRDWQRWATVLIAGGTALVMWTFTWLPIFSIQLQQTTANYWIWKPTLGTAAYMLL